MDCKKTSVFLSFIVAIIFSQGVSFAFTANFTNAGTIPPGTVWNVTVDGVLYNATGSNNISVSGLTGTVAYSYTTPIAGASGIRYTCTGCTGSVSADTTVTKNYQKQYRLQMSINETGAGTTLPAVGSSWYNDGTPVTISAAVIDSNYTFLQWTGSGTGTFYTGTNNPRTITMNGPINERADFTKKTTINFTKSGIPGGTSWNVTVNGVTYTSTGSKITVTGLSGTVSYSYGSTFPGPLNTRYLCNTGCSGSLTTDAEVNANYQTQYLLNMMINESGAGTTTPPLGTSWRNAGEVITISAALEIGYSLDRWVGTGAGSYSGTLASTTITMNGPIEETVKVIDYTTYITSISDIQSLCPYFPASHTYYCTEKVRWSPSGTAIIDEADTPVTTDYSSATFTQNSFTGTFTGANPATFTAGGTCAPINANASITGICEGNKYKTGDCTKLPAVTTNFGYFLKHEIDGGWCGYRLCSYDCNYVTSFNTGESCSVHGEGDSYWSFDCCYVSRCDKTSGGCTATSYANQENLPANCNGQARTYYIPCTYSPSITVNGMFHQYPGVVKNTTTVTLPLNNLKVGTNTLQLASQESGKFSYTIRWLEANSLNPCVTSERTKAYHISSGNIMQSGENARIINGTFDMKFDSTSTETTIALLRDGTNSVGSVRINQYDSSNLKLELYNGTNWDLVASNIQPKKWYTFSVTLDESMNKITVKMENVEYGTVLRTLNIPAASPAIKWISITSNGAWLDNVNIDKRDISNNLISAYYDNFESYDFGESVLYNGTETPFYNINITNDISIDPDGVNGKHIIFKAVRNFESKTISSSYGTTTYYGDTAYGSTGNIEIHAKKIKFNNLYSNCPGVGTNDDDWCGPGSLTLVGNTINGNIMQAYGGYECVNNVGGCFSSNCWGRRPGSVYITANSTNINYIYSDAAAVDRPADGGMVIISSENVTIQELRTNSYNGKDGGNGGLVMIKGSRINVGSINANGGAASGNAYCGGGWAGAGGPITIVAKEYINIPSITANGGSGEHAGGGGSIRLSATNMNTPIKLSANGASGGVFSGTSGNGNSYEYATPASAGGSINVYADHINSELNISVTGGNAVGMSYFTGFSTGCELGSAGVGGVAAIFSDNLITGSLNINNKGGSGADYRTQWTIDCQIVGGSDGGVIIRKRTWGGFIGLNASIMDKKYNSYVVLVKDLWTDSYLKQKNDTFLDYYYNKTLINGMEGDVAVKKIANAFIGFAGGSIPPLPTFDMALGKDYQLEITTSSCDTFTNETCPHLDDRTYIIPFVEY